MSPRKGFDRVMVHHDLASNLKLIDFTDSEVKAFVLGVLPIASMADMRGAFTVGKAPATAAHVAEQARVTKRVGTSTIAKLRDVGILELHDDGVEWVHDFHEYNPAPKVDDTSAERAKKYRESQKAKRDASRPVTRDVTPRHGTVTPTKVEGEVEAEGTAFTAGLTSQGGSGSFAFGDPGPDGTEYMPEWGGTVAQFDEQHPPSNVTGIFDGKTGDQRGVA